MAQPLCPPTIAERLYAIGYSFRVSKIAGKQEVFHLDSGRVVGQYDIVEAVAFLKRMGD